MFARAYGLECIGLRYFNVFGARQDPNGPYAAVIPQWVQAMLRNQPVHINGDGSTSRDFCYIANTVQANLLAATASDAATPGGVFNVALNSRTTLTELFELLRVRLAKDLSWLRDVLLAHPPPLPSGRCDAFAGRHFAGAASAGLRADAHR